VSGVAHGALFERKVEVEIGYFLRAELMIIDLEGEIKEKVGDQGGDGEEKAGGGAAHFFNCISGIAIRGELG
jgi:hypothetical protein